MRGCPLTVVKAVVLKCLQGISSSAKCQILLPVLEEMIETREQSLDVSSMLLASIDDAAASELNDEKSTSWAIYTKVLGHYFRKGVYTYYGYQHLNTNIYIRPQRRLQLKDLYYPKVSKVVYTQNCVQIAK